MQNDLAWYRAVNLSERIALRRGAGQEPGAPAEPSAAGRRLRAWKEQSPFMIGTWLERRLATDDLDEDEFASILGESPEQVAHRAHQAPEWLSWLTAAYADGGSTNGGKLPEPPEDPGTVAFLRVFSPLLRKAIARIQRYADELSEAHPSAPFEAESVMSILYPGMALKLSSMVSRVMVLELNVARVQGELDGESPPERFRSFIERLEQRETALTLLKEYSVLARFVVGWSKLWADASIDFLARLCADWDAIRATFSPGRDPGRLEQLSVEVGDRHRGGRAVIIAQFTSGLRVVYKPRSMAVDVRFRHLLAWLNARGAPDLRSPEVLDCGEYGWSECIEHSACGQLQEIERFYHRQGAFLALLYVLAATDFHNENLIAAGEHPMLIDLESLLRPQISERSRTYSSGVALSEIFNSVLRVGLLPQYEWAGEEGSGLETSGLGGQKGQMTPVGVPRWESDGTDAMRLVRKRVEVPVEKNRPTLGDEDIDVQAYTGTIVDGFTAMYRLLLEHRDEILSEAGPLASFAGAEVRVIMRHTSFYSLLLNESLHPDALRDALDRDRLFDRLWFGLKEGEALDKLVRVIPSERRDLWQGDIPYFSTRTDSLDLSTGAGERLENFFSCSGLQRVRDRFSRLNEEDLRRQVWFIRGAMTILSGDTEPNGSGERPREDASAEGPKSPLETACRLGDRLEELALYGEQDASWIGLSLVSARRDWALIPAGIDLYSGNTGIALFLAYLGEISGEERYTRLARAALMSARTQLDEIKAQMQSLGGFDGWGGLIHAWTHFAALWRDPDLLAEAEEMVAFLPPLIEKDTDLDVVSGSAGCLVSLLHVYRQTGHESVLKLARRMGEWIIARAQDQEEGVGWPVPVSPQQPLAGFSHGASGFAWALLELYGQTGEERFLATARQALAFERSVFSPARRNWPDLRVGDGGAADAPDRFMVAWCHGAPGIGISRTQMLRHLDEPEIRADIDAALATTLAQGFGTNHSLCHGDLGNLELLLKASEVLDDPVWGQKADRVATWILKRIQRDGWDCGVPFAVETPGLLVGLAGIGYQLLRVAEPARVPSILLLEPPLTEAS